MLLLLLENSADPNQHAGGEREGGREKERDRERGRQRERRLHHRQWLRERGGACSLPEEGGGSNRLQGLSSNALAAAGEERRPQPARGRCAFTIVS